MPITTGARPHAKARNKAKARLSHRVRPDGMTLNVWQLRLRIQAGQEADFRWKSLDGGALLGDYQVENPASKRSYLVAIRARTVGANTCTCPDFAVNTLGTCKHIEFLLHRLRRKPGAAHAFAAGFRSAWSELGVRHGGRPRLLLRLGDACPPALRALAKRHAGPDGVIAEGERVGALLHAAEQTGHELRVSDEARRFLAREADERHRRAALDQAFPRGAADPALATLLSGAKLHPYQCEGAWFAATTGRCLLADDMGLGKTVQAIAVAELLRRHAHVRRVLVVTPVSLKGQWAEEIARFTKHQALVVGGALEARTAAWRDQAPAIKIANYEQLLRDLPAINAWGPDLLILDEAQRIKNRLTRAAVAVRRIDSPYLLVLTGTPLENRLDELHALVEVVDRHLLGPLFAFRERHAIVEDDSHRVVGYRDLDHLAETLRPLLLRRTRAQVLKDLPPRTQEVRRVPLTDAQRQYHDEDREIVARLVHKWRRCKFLSEADQLRMTCALQRMRMVCDSTYLLEPAVDDNRKLAELEAILDAELADPGTKVVLFSAWLKAHELVQRLLERRGWGHVFLHGGVAGKDRQELVRRFRDDPACRVFLATDAGNSGLNLQWAAVLVNLDLPWNPAVLEQRIGRIHRMGQARPVRIYNLVAEHSIESAIERTLAFKKGVFAGVLDGGASEVRLDGTGLQRFMADLAAVDETLGAQAAGAAADQAEQAEAAVAEVAAETTAAGEAADQAPAAEAPSAAAAPGPAALAGAFSAGAELLAGLGRLAASATVERGADGQASLRIPLPDPATLARIQAALAAFATLGR
jgi:superfamily II DNA or RNA helicase